MIAEITYCGVHLVVHGEHYPASPQSMLNPPEPATFDIADIRHAGVSIMELLSDDQCSEIIAKILRSMEPGP